MDQTTKQPTGDFYAPVNRYKQPGDDKPIFTEVTPEAAQTPASATRSPQLFGSYG